MSLMSPTMLLILAAAAAVGLVLVLLGWRGKRINDHPVCRGCGFDLIGVLPAGATCPECGAGLKRDKAIRKGQRRKRVLVASTGAVLIALPALTGGALGYALATGANLNEYKPLALLRWELRYAGEGPAEAATEEMRRRYTEGGLDEEGKRSLVRFVLAAQADENSHWSERLGDIVESARGAGDISEQEFHEYMREGARLTFMAPKLVAIGDPIPVVAAVNSRLGGAAAVVAEFWVRDVRIDDRPVEVRTQHDGAKWISHEDVAPAGWVYILGSGMTPREKNDLSTVGFLVVPPARLPAGQHVVDLELLSRVEEKRGGQMSWTRPGGDPGLQGYEGKAVRLTFRTVEDSSAISPEDWSPDLEEQLLRSLAVDAVHIKPDSEPSGISLRLSITEPPCDFAFEATLRQGDRQWDLGPITNGFAASQSARVAYQEGTHHFWGEALGIQEGTADLVLTPSDEVRGNVVGLDSVYGREIVISDIPVKPRGY